MSFARQLTTRNAARADASDPRPVSVSLQAASQPPIPPRAWAEQFARDAAVVELSTADFLATLRECDTYKAASDKLARLLTSGRGLAAARPAAQADVARQLIASHAKAHEPTGRMRHR